MKTKHYKSPAIEVVEIELEGAMLSDSGGVSDIDKGQTW